MIYTTSESVTLAVWSCFMVQSYKFWMIYTTLMQQRTAAVTLFYGAKLQILNDIHNRADAQVFLALGCFMVQSYKFWMIYTTNLSDVCSCMQLFYGAKLQILNDIHNSPSRRVRAAGSCFMVQSYKFWMIYTTNLSDVCSCMQLFYGAKLQILNDIHNQLDLLLHLGLAVLWCKVTNFEWYTQQHPSYDLLNQAVLWCKVTNFEWYTQL